MQKGSEPVQSSEPLKFYLLRSFFLYCAGVRPYTFLHCVMNDFTFAKPFSSAAAETVEFLSSISLIAFSRRRFARYSEKLTLVMLLKYFEKYDGERLTTDEISLSGISRL